jgi:DNA-binding transcriptional regulator YiaG
MKTDRYVHGDICLEIQDFEPEDIKKIRDHLGLTQFEFAVKYNVPIYTVQAWERGARKPKDRHFQLLLEKLYAKCNIDNLEVV